MRVIEKSHATETFRQDSFLYVASKILCAKGYKFVKKATLKLHWCFIKYWKIDLSYIFLYE